MKVVEVFVRGPGAAASRDPRLEATGLAVTAITDVTPIPHNGCRHRSGPGLGERELARYTGPVCRLCRR